MVRFFVSVVFILILNISLLQANNHEEPLSPNISNDLYTQNLVMWDDYYNENKNLPVIVDWVLAVSTYGHPNIIRDYNGNMSFSADADRVRVGVILPKSLSVENRKRLIETNDVVESLYDEKITTQINKLLLAELAQLRSDNFFNNKPYEFTAIPSDSLKDLEFFQPGDRRCFSEMAGATLDYDILIAPAACFYTAQLEMYNPDILMAGYYPRNDLYLLALAEIENASKIALAGKEVAEKRSLVTKQAFTESIDWEKEKIERYIKRFSQDYWNNYSLEIQLEHASSMSNSYNENFNVVISDDLNVQTFDNSLDSKRLTNDWAVVLNKNNKAEFIEDIDGNFSFGGDSVKVGVILPKSLSIENKNNHSWLKNNALVESIYDEELNDSINELLFSEIEKSIPIEYFNNKPYEFTAVASEMNNSLTSFELGNELCFNEMVQYSYDYDLVVVPACIFNNDGTFKKPDLLNVIGYFPKDPLYQNIAEDKRKAKEEAERAEEDKKNAYLNALEKNPGNLTFVTIGDSGVICTLNTIPVVMSDAAIIDKWGKYYQPNLYNSVNDLFIEITQKKEDECWYLLLPLADKEKLKNALGRKSIEVNDDKSLVDESKLTLNLLNQHFASVDIKDEGFYKLFAKMQHDEVLFAELLKYNITNQSQLDELIIRIKTEAPDLSSDTNQGIYDFLLLDQEAQAEGIDIASLTANKNAEDAARQKKIEEERIAKKLEYARNNPYYAVVTCSYSYDTYPLAACLSETTITLTKDGNTREKKFYELTDIGNVENDKLYIDLPYEYTVNAQNSSEALSIRIEVYDRLTDNLIKSDEANSLWGVARVNDWN